MSHVEIHHYQVGFSRRSKAMLVKPVPESGKAWTTYEGYGHFHKSDTAAERCATKRWRPQHPDQPDGSE